MRLGVVERETPQSPPCWSARSTASPAAECPGRWRRWWSRWAPPWSCWGWSVLVAAGVSGQAAELGTSLDGDLALLLLGVPLMLPLSLLVFLGAFIPVVGSAVAGGVAVLVALVTKGPTTAALVLVAVVVVQQVDGDVLAPIVFGRALSLHPLAVVVALTGGAVLGGVLGAAISVPLAASGWAVVRAVRPQVTEPAPADVPLG